MRRTSPERANARRLYIRSSSVVVVLGIMGEMRSAGLSQVVLQELQLRRQHENSCEYVRLLTFSKPFRGSLGSKLNR